MDKKIQETLLKSIENKDITQFKYLVEQGADIYDTVYHNTKSGDLDAVKFIIDNTEDYDDEYNEYLLLVSVHKEHFDIIKYLIEERHVDIHTEDDEALLYSIENGNDLEIIKYLIEQGADIHAQDDAALILSIGKGYDFELTKYLIEEGANIHAQDNEALKTSAEYKYIDVLKYLMTFYTQQELIDLNIPLVNRINQIQNQAVRTIQQTVVPWLYRPTGELARRNFENIEKIQSGSGTIKKLCKKCNINYKQSDKQKYKELSRYFKKLSL
jgi:ankyrin repeat protein